MLQVVGFAAQPGYDYGLRSTATAYSGYGLGVYGGSISLTPAASLFFKHPGCSEARNPRLFQAHNKLAIRKGRIMEDQLFATKVTSSIQSFTSGKPQVVKSLNVGSES
ncbi:hypothetical protein E4U57_002483 [Claviceps arundinis]|uniref:Uncharacterized protein n=1 Tax=Claviceps arundinis TaxID=1623583 RepID=A0A9P7MYT2_9HYPO|nr:hypothetical protein E4U57_002483 [Claviceps arundinis]KAG5975498.1 hypothetical protein E4U56_003698 [Claviceps arundinis]